MPKLNIPEEYKKTIRRIAGLSETAFDELSLAFRAVEPAMVPIERVDKLVPLNIKQVSSTEATDILRLLLVLSTGVSMSARPPEVLAKDITETVEDEIGDQERETLRLRLTDLLGIQPIRLVARSMLIVHDHDKVITDAKVLTDLRPVFSDGVEKSPIGMLVLHTLKLDYRTNDEEKQFYAVMDTRDLQDLIEVLQRAQKKAENLQEILSSANVTYVDALRDLNS